jgi:hypothetical protein
MNPFFLGPEFRVNKDSKANREEGFRLRAASMQKPSLLALRLGRLLIRMGSKLAHENTSVYKTRNVVS